MHDTTLSQVLELDRNMLQGFSEEEAQLLIDMLAKVQDNLNNIIKGEGND